MKSLQVEKFTPWRFTIVNPQSLQQIHLLAFGATLPDAEKHLRDYLGFEFLISECYRISNPKTIVNAEFISPTPLISAL